ncbi:hypothetical protein TNCV_1090561 [Trichonephila clavipes]|uniref:Uncharacterized protein n=1 Tax=Trichonephila clavipes TaxID=2585209 RepID=A0A8X6SNZ2_TRICX|nr:hypothetical protein TNCV_1090561 [Trichonephila clavipes]
MYTQVDIRTGSQLKKMEMISVRSNCSSANIPNDMELDDVNSCITLHVKVPSPGTGLCKKIARFPEGSVRGYALTSGSKVETAFCKRWQYYGYYCIKIGI